MSQTWNDSPAPEHLHAVDELLAEIDRSIEGPNRKRNPDMSRAAVESRARRRDILITWGGGAVILGLAAIFLVGFLDVLSWLMRRLGF